MHVKIELILTGFLNIPSPLLYSQQNWESLQPYCICALDSFCEKPAAIYDERFSWKLHEIFMNYVIPGWKMSCFDISSLLHSTLECLYNESDCLRVIRLNVQRLAFRKPEHVDYNIRIRPLIYDSKSSRFPLNTTVEALLQHLMVDQWNYQVSYKNYYDSCSPIYCTYSSIRKNKTFIQLLIACIAMISGLTLVVRLISWNLTRISFGVFYRSTRQADSSRI